MKHYSGEMWLQYIDGNIEEARAEAMEGHLAQCDACLKLYVFLAESSVSPPVSARFTQEVMAQVVSSREAPSPERSRLPTILPVPQRIGSLRQSLGNYAIAALLTLLLTAGGIFANVAAGLPEFTGSEMSLADTAAQKVGFGWSEAIAEKTLSILAIFKPD